MPKRKARVGRPRLKNGLAKAGMLRVRLTPERIAAVERKAKAAKVTVSDWIRSTIDAALGVSS
jgi:predicted HicB family RNase H-like nuclease